MSRVHVSLPLTGPSARLGRELLRGIRLAAPDADWQVGDSHATDREARALRNARRAAEDPEALAYLGDVHSDQVGMTAPLLGEAGLLTVAPVATWTELAGPTLVRLSPDDAAGARAIARWLVEQAVPELLVVHDHDRWYGRPVGALCAEAARAAGIATRARPVWDHGEEVAADLGDAQAVLYVGVAGSGAAALWRTLHTLDPALWLLGTEGVAQPWLAAELDDGAAGRTRLFVAQHASAELYGHEAARVVLDALAAGDDRAAVARAGRATHERDSLLGRYGLDADGLTTTGAYGRLAVVDGALVWDVA